MTDTANYGWPKPSPGGDDDVWGDTLNEALDAIDTDLQTVSDAKNSLNNATFAGTLKKAAGGHALYHGNSSFCSGKVTVSTADPSGTPADGDIWIKYTS